MTSIRKAKKWYKSCINFKNEYEKKLGTIRKCPAFHRYIMRHRTSKREFCTFTGQNQEESEVSMRRRFFKLFGWRIPRKLKKAAKYGVERRIYPTTQET